MTIHVINRGDIVGNTPAKPRRQRRLSLTAKLNALHEVGAKGGTIGHDGSLSFTFGEMVQTAANGERNEWDEELTNGADQAEIR